MTGILDVYFVDEFNFLYFMNFNSYCGISLIIFDVAISDTLMQSVNSPGIPPSPGSALSGLRSRWVDNYRRSNPAS